MTAAGNRRAHAITFARTGGPDVLEWGPVDVPDPGPGEIRIRHTAVGLNFVDTYHRSGLYALRLPSGLGLEAAGVVEAVGEGVRGLDVGMRVAYGTGTPGAYSEARTMAADVVVEVPDDVDDATAAAMILKGLTVQYLIRQIHRVGPDTVLVNHAAAGGVGLILSQWAAHLGATVIGTVGSEEKADLARAAGCAHVILYREADVATAVRELTDGRGVEVVYDGIGADTFATSLDSLRPRGLLVSYGNASGPVPPFSPAVLAAKGSLFLTRPVLANYADTPERTRAMADELFAVVRSGAVHINVGQTFPLADAARAHAELEAGRTTGSTVLLP